MNHSGDANKMVSDTPRTTDRVVFIDGNPWVNAPFARGLERELNAATSEIERLTAKVAQLYDGAEKQKQLINRLEEAGDAMVAHAKALGMEGTGLVKRWKKAKEDKP